MLDFKTTPPQQAEQTQTEQEENHIYDLLIVGGGPAGLTAAIYAGRAALDTLLFAGATPGGQIANTDVVENYPGFPEGISGPDLAMRFQSQAEHFVTRLANDFVTAVDFSTAPFTVETQSQPYHGRTVIVATGAYPRRLGVPGENAFFGRGVSTCATCDGFFYRDKRVVVVGGGDSAIDEGLFLTKFARQVLVIHRRDELRATKSLQERAFANEKMAFAWDTVVEEILGDQTVTGVQVRNVKTDEQSIIETDGVFIYIGLIPMTKVFQDQLALDDSGYIITDSHQRTSVPGIFAAGDVQSPDFRQVIIAAGDGARAVIAADRYLAETSEGGENFDFSPR